MKRIFLTFLSASLMAGQAFGGVVSVSGGHGVSNYGGHGVSDDEIGEVLESSGQGWDEEGPGSISSFTNDEDELESLGGAISGAFKKAGGDIAREAKHAGGDIAREVKHAGGDVARETKAAEEIIVNGINIAGFIRQAAEGAAERFHNANPNADQTDCVIFTTAAVSAAGAFFSGPAAAFFSGAAGAAASRFACRRWFPDHNEG